MYGGTKSEMQRLVKDAAKLDKSIDGNSLSYANIVKAIHAVQESMYITGTTQKEAEHTITGSLSMVKSAWQNLMPALIQGGDSFEQCVENLVYSIEKFADNAMPAIEKALAGVGTLIEKLVPKLAKKFPEYVEMLLPPLITAAVSLIKGLIAALPNIVKILINELPTIAKELSTAIDEVISSMPKSGASGLLSGIFGDIKGAVDKVIPTVSNFIRKIGEFVKSKETLEAFKGAWDKIKKAAEAVWFVVEPIISLIANNLDKIIPAIMNVIKVLIAFKIVMAAVNFVMAASPITWIIAGIVALVAAIALCVKHWDKIKAVASSCWEAIKGAWSKAGEWFKTTIVQPIATFFSSLWSGIKTGAKAVLNFFKTIGTWVYENVITPIVNFVKSCVNAIVKILKGFVKVITVIVLGIIGLICQGVIKIATWINTKVIQPVWNAICTVWGKISSWVSTNIIQPIVRFFTALWNKIKSVVQAVKNTIVTIWGKVSSWVNANVIQPIARFFTALWSRLKNGIATIWNTLCSIWGKISAWVNGKVIQPIVSLFSTLWGKIKSVASSIKNTLVEAFKSAWDKVTGVWNGLKKFFSGIWEGLKETGETLKTTLVGIWKDAVKAISKPVNKLIGGANWVLEKLGSETRVAEWQPYANGTNGHKGGNALVNDGKGAELVQMPNGQSFIPKGRNVFIPNAPKGMKVLPAEQTARLAGKSSPTFRYKDGTGFDIWDFFGKSKGLADKIIEKFVSFKDLSGYTLDVGKSMISKTKGALSDWVSKMFNKLGGRDISSYVASKGVEQWRSTVVSALKMENQYSAANVKRTLYQMQTESGGNPKAINLWDSNAKKGTPSKGLMQVIDPTFNAYAKSGFDKDIYDPLSNILASVRYAVSRYGTLEKAYKGKGYANGGIATKPSIFGEDGAEMAIPLSADKRQRGIDLWNKTGAMLGLSSYTPENSASSYYSNDSTEYNNYSPQFNLTISGTSDDRAMARKVKRWINEAINDTFDSYSSKNPKLREV